MNAADMFGDLHLLPLNRKLYKLLADKLTSAYASAMANSALARTSLGFI